jgi:hypothetical protein
VTQNFNWRDNEYVQEAREIAEQAWEAAKKASPIAGALGGLAVMFVFGRVLPLMLHIFFGDIEGVVGSVLGFLSGLLSSLFRIFGFAAGLICWGAALRNFAACRRQLKPPAPDTVAASTEPATPKE